MRITGVVAILIVWASLAGCSRQNPHPVKSVRRASQMGNYLGWQLRDMVGDRDGPFRSIGDIQLTAAGSGRYLTYLAGGTTKRYGLDHLKGELLLGRFQNKAGNSMVLVFTKEPAGGDEK